MFKEFKEFALKGSVLDLAVGVVIGAAFGAIITAFVDDLINPIIGVLIGDTNLADKSVSLGGQAVLNYGSFLNAVINFLIVAFVLFLVVKAVNRFRKAEEPTTRPCPFCTTDIAKSATKCPACTSEVTAEA